MKTLKHLCFIGIAVLLASAMVSCDFVEKPNVPGGDNIVGYTEDGTPLVSLTIGVPTGRALTLPLARAGVDYYEVIFRNGTDYYRASWNYTQKGKIIIPAVTYASATEAILFAGRSSDKTLLAVGLITDPPSGAITLTTTTITFGLTALTTDVKADPDSSFQITEPDTHLTADLTTANFPKAKVGNAVYPVFMIPENVDGTIIDPVEASFEVGGISAANNDGIIVAGAGEVFFTAEIVASELQMPTVSGGTVLPASGPVPDDGLFTIEDILSSNHIGFSRMALRIPVSAISLANDVNGVEPITWYIRGGMINADLDLGSAANSLGGAILLGVGNVNGYLIETTGP
jgi:hypothetical protein